MRNRGRIALLLAFCITVNAAVMGTGVLCIEMGGHTLIERVFDCVTGNDCAPDDTACDSCVDVPVQTTGADVPSSSAWEEIARIAHATAADLMSHEVADGLSPLSDDVAGSPTLVDQAGPDRFTVLRC